VETGRIEDVDLVGGRGDEPGQPELSQYARHHLADRTDGIREFLLGHPGDELAARTLLGRREVEQMRGDPLSYRAEGVDRGLSERAAVVSSPASIRKSVHSASVCTPTSAGPATSTAIPSTSRARAYRTVT
jgi:hypothetical protein